MANHKNFNSKNLSTQIEALLKLGKADLAMDILKAKELRGLLPNILNTLKRKSKKQEDFEQTKIYSKTDLNSDLLKKLEDTLHVDTKSAKIIIDEKMSAGVRIKSHDRLIDATLETMLEQEVQNLLAKI